MSHIQDNEAAIQIEQAHLQEIETRVTMSILSHSKQALFYRFLTSEMFHS